MSWQTSLFAWSGKNAVTFKPTMQLQSPGPGPGPGSGPAPAPDLAPVPVPVPAPAPALPGSAVSVTAGHDLESSYHLLTATFMK